jgi:hypothetical protein
MLRMRRVLSLLCALTGLTSCVPRISADDPGSQAAATAVDDPTAFYLGQLGVDNGMHARLMRIVPAGNPIYILDLPNPAGSPVTGAHCSVNSYYSLLRGQYARIDDVNAQIAGVANPGDRLPTPSDDCQTDTCTYDPAWAGANPSWGYMDEGINWVFREGESLRVLVKPTEAIASGGLRMEAICRGIDGYW